VTNSTSVPGAKAIAHGLSIAPFSSTANGSPPEGAGVLSPVCAWLQLAISSAAGDRAAIVSLILSMLSGTPSRDFAALFAAGELVVGVDAAGRGPLAGPVVAAAVVLCKPRPAGPDDSKKLSAERRGALEDRIRRRCAFGIGVVEVGDIDALNIFQATMWAMAQAVARLCEVIGCDATQVLVDGNLTPAGRRGEWRWPARAIVGGDALEPCISAASILAKEHRDRLMREYARQHPHYGWEANKGYGTPDHLAALRRHGPCPLHRRSFAPVAQCELPLEITPAM
jgi:ribonuclease HII